jgi:hypothetical protein
MTSDVEIPIGTYPVILECFNCGQQIQSWTDANMSDPETADLVKRIMRMTLCDRCHRLAGKDVNGQFTGPNR